MRRYAVWLAAVECTVRLRDGGARREGEGRTFGSRHIHTVANLGDRPALSVHVYSPALRGMTRYALLDNRLRETSIERAGEQW